MLRNLQSDLHNDFRQYLKKILKNGFAIVISDWSKVANKMTLQISSKKNLNKLKAENIIA